MLSCPSTDKGWIEHFILKSQFTRQLRCRMNAAFEDCFLLYQSLKADRANRPAGEQLDFLACIQEFADKRTPSANGLADLCLEHYHGVF